MNRHPLPIRNNAGDAILEYRGLSDLDILKADGSVIRGATYRDFMEAEKKTRKRRKDTIWKT